MWWAIWCAVMSSFNPVNSQLILMGWELSEYFFYCDHVDWLWTGVAGSVFTTVTYVWNEVFFHIKWISEVCEMVPVWWSCRSVNRTTWLGGGWVVCEVQWARLSFDLLWYIYDGCVREPLDPSTTYSCSPIYLELLFRHVLPMQACCPVVLGDIMKKN